MTITALQDGDIIDSTESKQIEDVVASLQWVVSFCNEHPEWMGNERSDKGSEFEWLENANLLLNSI